MRTISAARQSNSPGIVGQEVEETEKKRSVEFFYEIIIQRFDKLGNQTTLTERNFRMEGVVPNVSQESSKIDNIDISGDKSFSHIDLEEGQPDLDVLVVVNRIEHDKLSEEIAAPNCCAICLERYSKGEEVVWSANENCRHIYHKTCITTYFAHAKKKGKKRCDCPICRQEFLVLSDEDKNDQENGLNAATTSSIVRTRQQIVLGQRI
jgi:hypothetical protein